jgi:hypothetical protein
MIRNYLIIFKEMNGILSAHYDLYGLMEEIFTQPFFEEFLKKNLSLGGSRRLAVENRLTERKTLRPVLRKLIIHHIQ